MEAEAHAVDTSWPQPLPQNWQLGQSGGICVDKSDDGVWVVNRRDLNKEEVETSTAAPSIMKFDRDGNVVDRMVALGDADAGAFGKQHTAA